MEFQKRGLPHAHILLKYTSACDSTDDIDAVVSTENPDDPADAQLVCTDDEEFGDILKHCKCTSRAHNGGHPCTHTAQRKQCLFRGHMGVDESVEKMT